MHGDYGKSIGPRVFLTVNHSVALSLFGWLVFGNGWRDVAQWLAVDLTPGDPGRRAFLMICAAVYLARVLLTVFRFLEREMAWGEALTVSVWVDLIYFVFALCGGTNPSRMRAVGFLGVALYAVGSYLNTLSEEQRFRWKRSPENRGRLFTGGLFTYAVHINYFGDQVLFTGFALVTGNPLALVIPAIMAFLFIRVSIPTLDRHLRRHYGEAFDLYAQKTKKFIPFLY